MPSVQSAKSEPLHVDGGPVVGVASQLRVGPDGEIIATITDDRDDEPSKRMHENIGNEYIVPPNKITKKDGNPTGHAIIFLGTSSIFGLRSEARPVLCYVMNGEV
jgi:hypothetical protein